MNGLSENNSIDQKAYDKAVDLLNRREHSIGELRVKLLARKFSESAVKAVLDELINLNFLNDERFTRVFVQNMREYKDWGYFGLRAKLLKKHIDEQQVERILQELFPKSTELEVAERLVEKLKRRGRDSYEKLAGSLSRKGFRNEVISEVLNKQ